MARNFDLSIRLKAVVEGLKDLATLAQEIEEVGHSSDETAEHAAELGRRLQDTQEAASAATRFERLQDALEETGDQLDNARRETELLGRQLERASDPTEEMRQEFERSRRETEFLEQAYQDLGQQAQAAGRRLEAMGVDTRDAANAQAGLERNVDELGQEYGELARATEAARQASARDFQDPTDRVEQGARQTNQQMDRLATRIKRVAATAIGSVAAFFGLQQAIRGVTGIARTGGDMEVLQKRLEAIMGSLEGGQEATAWIQQFAKETPFQLQEVTEAFIRAKAFGMDPMNGTMQAIADQASVLGGDMETLNGITTALGQAYAKQKLQAEEVLQLVERGVPAWDLLAEATGKNVQQLQEMSSAGELGRKEIDLLVKAMGEQNMGAAASQMEILGGRVSNLKDNFREFVEEVNRQGFLDYVKGQLAELQAFIADATEDGRLQQWAKDISDTLIALGNGIRGTIEWLVKYREAIGLAAKAWVAYKGVQAAGAILGLAANLRRKMIPALNATTGATNAATGAMGRLRLAMLAIPGAGIIAAIGVAAFELPRLFDKAGTAIGEWAAKHSDAGKRLAETQRRIREEAEQNITFTELEIRQQEKYRDAQVRTAEEVLAMSQAQRAEYEEQLAGLGRLQMLEYRLAMLREQTGQDTTEQQRELAQAIEATREAQERLSTASHRVQQGIENGLSPAAARLVEQYRDMIAAGKDAEEAAQAIFETLESPGNFEQVQALIEAMATLGGESREAAEAIQEELSGALEGMTGEELQVFVTTLRAAFGKGEEFAGAFADAAQEAADAAFRNLGSSLREFETGISDAEHSAIASFLALEDAGILTSDNIGRAFEDLVGQIKSPAAVREIESLLDALERRGFEVTDEMRLAFQEMAEGIEGTAEKIGADLKAAIESAGSREELNELGVRLATAWREGKIGIDEYLDGLEALQGKQAEVAQEAREKAQEAGDAWTDAGSKARGAADATGAVGDAAEQAGDKAKQAGSSAGGFLAAIVSGMRSAVDQIDLSMRAMAKLPEFLQTKATVAAGSIEQLKGQLQTLTAQAREHMLSLNQAGFVPGLNRWLREAYGAIYQTQIAYTEQRLAVEKLTEALREGGDASEAFNRSGRDGVRMSRQMQSALSQLGGTAGLLAMDMDDLRARFDHLDEAELSGLYSEIQRIQSEIQSLNDSLQDTVRAFEQELAGLEGDTARVEQLKFQEEQAELQEQLNRARELGDQEAIAAAQKALGLNRQIHDQRMEQIKEQAAEQKAQEAAREVQEAERKAQEEAQRREEREWQREQSRLGRLVDTADQDRRDREARTVVDPITGLGSSRTVNLNIQANGQQIGTLTNVDEEEAARLLQAIDRAQLTAPRF
ncbi:MAG: tape measure protein [Halomonas sp.]